MSGECGSGMWVVSAPRLSAIRVITDIAAWLNTWEWQMGLWRGEKSRRNGGERGSGMWVAKAMRRGESPESLSACPYLADIRCTCPPKEWVPMFLPWFGEDYGQHQP